MFLKVINVPGMALVIKSVSDGGGVNLEETTAKSTSAADGI